MKSAIIIRHLAFEDFGSLTSVLLERDYDIRTVDATRDDLAEVDINAADLVVVLGGPIGAFDEARYPFLLQELRLIKSRLETGKKLLGICLGAQLIARALGSQVASMGCKEIGFGELTLTAAGRGSCLAPLADGVPVLHWHGDRFQIPACAERLAGTAICPDQAFAVGHAVLGLQFHLEVDPGHLESWLVGHAGELESVGIEPNVLRGQATQVGGRLVPVARHIFAQWLDAN